MTLAASRTRIRLTIALGGKEFSYIAI